MTSHGRMKVRVKSTHTLRPSYAPPIDGRARSSSSSSVDPGQWLADILSSNSNKPDSDFNNPGSNPDSIAKSPARSLFGPSTSTLEARLVAMEKELRELKERRPAGISRRRPRPGPPPPPQESLGGEKRSASMSPPIPGRFSQPYAALEQRDPQAEEGHLQHEVISAAAV